MLEKRFFSKLQEEAGQMFLVASLKLFYHNENDITRLQYKLARRPALHATVTPMLSEVIALEQT